MIGTVNFTLFCKFAVTPLDANSAPDKEMITRFCAMEFNNTPCVYLL